MVFHELGQRLELRDFGSHVELRIGHVPILTSLALGTEVEFGHLASKLKVSASPRVLVGGLGFGGTLSAVLACVDGASEVVLVERLGTIIQLMKNELAYLRPGVLDDRRVNLVHDDVASVIARERDLDVILLDVDNGPEWASFRSNSKLYSPKGLHAAFAALKPGGAFAVWSGYPVDEFIGDLRAAGFGARAIDLYEGGKVAARAYVGTKARR